MFQHNTNKECCKLINMNIVRPRKTEKKNSMCITYMLLSLNLTTTSVMNEMIVLTITMIQNNKRPNG